MQRNNSRGQGKGNNCWCCDPRTRGNGQANWCKVDARHGDNGPYNYGQRENLKEWGFVLGEAGFSRYTVKPIRALQSVIEASP